MTEPRTEPADVDEAPPFDLELERAACCPAEPSQSSLAVMRALDAPDELRRRASLAYQQWINAGKPFTLAYPCNDLMGTLRRAGYTVYAYPNEEHLRANTPEDHDPYAATGWPGVSPRWWGMAIDIMPPARGSGLPNLEQLGAQLVADKIGNNPAMAWLKYANWTRNGSCVHESWEPGHAVRPSSDTGHIHLSCRTDYAQSHAAAGYDPVARIRAGGGAAPVVAPPAPTSPVPAFPGRVLVARAGADMMHGTDVLTWQRHMVHERGWDLGTKGPNGDGCDGWYGDVSAMICEAFQRDSNAHNWPLDVDRKVGPATWRATWARPISR